MQSPKNKRKFPLLSTDHGHEMTTVVVGPQQQRFIIHKRLLAQASEYFNRALNGSFIEAITNTITLKQHHPEAFEVVYQWLYTGTIRAPDQFSQIQERGPVVNPYRTFWLRVFRLADETMISELKADAYTCFIQSFRLRPADKLLIDDIWSDSCPLPILKDFIASVTAYFISTKDTISAGVVEQMKYSWAENEEYCQMVLNRALDLAVRPRGEREHPRKHAKFSAVSAFQGMPAPETTRPVSAVENAT